MHSVIDSEDDFIPIYSAGELLDDDSPMPPDPIGPRILGFGGLLVLGGARNVGKTAFLLSGWRIWRRALNFSACSRLVH